MKTRKVLCLMLAVIAAVMVGSVAESGEATGVVNINTASSEQLELLPRVGPALAGRIVEFRDANGPFQSVDEIVAVKGIGERSFEMLEPYLVIDGATTLTEKVKSTRSSGGNKTAD
jgi:competence protein ComEA